MSRDRKAEFVFDSHYQAYILRSMTASEADGSQADVADTRDNPERTVRIVTSPTEHAAALQGGDVEDTEGQGDEFVRSVRKDVLTIGAEALASPVSHSATRPVEEGEEDELMVSRIYNGTANDETWRLDRVLNQVHRNPPSPSACLYCVQAAWRATQPPPTETGRAATST